MNIQSVPVDDADEASDEPRTEVIMLRVSGPVDPKDAILMRARELVLGTGSQAMIESFDWAVSSGSVVTDK